MSIITSGVENSISLFGSVDVVYGLRVSSLSTLNGHRLGEVGCPISNMIGFSETLYEMASRNRLLCNSCAEMYFKFFNFQIMSVL